MQMHYRQMDSIPSGKPRKLHNNFLGFFQRGVFHG